MKTNYLRFKLLMILWSATASYAQNQTVAFNQQPYRVQLTSAFNYFNPKPSSLLQQLWIPMLQNENNVLFVQADLNNQFNATHNTSGILGFRQRDFQSLWGVYSGYQQTIDQHKMRHKQLLVGAEWRLHRFNMFANGYLPLGRSQRNLTPTTVLAHIPNSALYKLQEADPRLQTLSGLELQAGYTLVPSMNARLNLGGYHFQAQGSHAIDGTQSSVDVDLYNTFLNNKPANLLNRITLSTGLTNDNIYHTRWYTTVSFNFTIGHQQFLDHFQQYMQYPVQHRQDIIVRPNDADAPTTVVDSNNKPLTIGYADDAKSLQQLISQNADVIAVRGDISNLDTIFLHDGQTLTGGDYYYNGQLFSLGANGSLTAANGQDLIRIAKDNTIESLHLTVDNGSCAITNNDCGPRSSFGSSIGNLTVANNTLNGSLSFVITDGSKDSHLNMHDNGLTLKNIDDFKSGLLVAVSNSRLEADIYDNAFSLSNSNSQILVALRANNYVTPSSTEQAEDAQLQINRFDHNTFAINSTGTIAVMVSSSYGNSLASSLISIGDISHNTFNYTSDLTDNKSIKMMTKSNAAWPDPEHIFTQIHVNHFANNRFNADNANNSKAVQIVANGGTINFNGFYGNTTTSSNILYNFEANQGVINVTVDPNDPTKTFTAANGASPQMTKTNKGEINIYPKPQQDT